MAGSGASQGLHIQICSFPDDTKMKGHKSTCPQRKAASGGSEVQTETMHVIIIANYTRGRRKTVWEM